MECYSAWNLPQNISCLLYTSENGSGIESVTYKIGNGGEQYIAYTESNGGYKFEININNDENLANNALTFIVRDKAKNEQTFVIDAVNSSKPIIKEASVVYSDNKEELEKATSKHSLIFGDERSKTDVYKRQLLLQLIQENKFQRQYSFPH